MFIRLATRHLHQIGEVFLFGVAFDQWAQGAMVHAAEVAGVARIAAPVGFCRGLKDQHAGTVFGGGDRGTKRRIAAADHDDIVGFSHSRSPS